jgi:hypothetical protein
LEDLLGDPLARDRSTPKSSVPDPSADATPAAPEPPAVGPDWLQNPGPAVTFGGLHGAVLRAEQDLSAWLNRSPSLDSAAQRALFHSMYASFASTGRLAALADSAEGRQRRKIDEAVLLAERFLSGDDESRKILPPFATLWIGGSLDRAGNEGAVLLGAIESLETDGPWSVATVAWSDSRGGQVQARVLSRTPLAGRVQVGDTAWMAGAWMEHPGDQLRDSPPTDGPVLVLGLLAVASP